MKKIKRLGTTDLQFRIAMSMMTMIVIGSLSFGFWSLLVTPVGLTWSSWYYPFGITTFVTLCVFAAPEKVLGVLADLAKGLTGNEDP